MLTASARTHAARASLAVLAAACVSALSLVDASPAHADTDTFTTATESTWVVPDGVTSVVYELVSGPGGVGGTGATPGGAGGLPTYIVGTLNVTPGQVLHAWAGQHGGDARGPFPGEGGAGYRSGGAGASGGSIDVGAGGGGGGSSALAVDGAEPFVIAAGGGGGGGSGAHSACPGAPGGWAGEPGASSPIDGHHCVVIQHGGAAGTNPAAPGADAANVPDPAANPNQAGSGGGGAGGGAAGATVVSTGLAAAGGGGGGGVNLLPSGAGAQTPADVVNGRVTIYWSPGGVEPGPQIPGTPAAPPAPTLPATGTGSALASAGAVAAALVAVGGAMLVFRARRRRTV